MRAVVVAIILPLVFVGLLAQIARADAVDERGQDLLTGRGYKVRLSAALWLSKRSPGDDKAINLLIRSVLGDREATIRRVAAGALAALVTEKASSAARARALSALAKAASRDRDKRVRKSATLALAVIRKHQPVIEDELDGHLAGLFVNIGAVTDKSRRLPRGVAPALQGAVRKALGRGAPQFGLGSSNDELPTRAQLRKDRKRGFFVGAAVVEIKSTRKGARVEVGCKVLLRVTPWSGKDGEERLTVEQTASATGSGRVEAGAKDATAAIGQCVLAVGEEVTTRQVVPFLRRFEGRAEN